MRRLLDRIAGGERDGLRVVPVRLLRPGHAQGGAVSLSLDNCVHCACRTEIVLKPRPDAPPPSPDAARAIELLDRGEIGCWNCEDGYDDAADGHVRCVQLLDGDGNVLWDGRCDKESGT